MARTGPMIEGAVSPTASKSVIQNALQQEKTRTSSGTSWGDTAYAIAHNEFGQGGSTGAVGNTLGVGAAANQTSPVYGTVRNPPPAPAPSGGGPLGGGYGGGLGGRSQYTDEEIAFMIGGGGGGSTGTGTGTGTGGGGGGGDGSANDGGGGGGTAPGGSGTLGDVSKEAIDAQINALTAKYGLDLASIAALGGEIGAQAKFLLAQLNRDQEFAQEDLLSNMVQRGIFKSGITARDTGRLQGDFASQRARVEMDKGSRLRQLAERAGAASAALGRGKADIIGEIDKGNLGAELRQTLLNELNSLTPADIQNALNAAYSGNQGSLTQLMQQGAGQSGINFGQAASAAQTFAGGGEIPQGAFQQGGYVIDPSTGLATQPVSSLTPEQLELLMGGTAGGVNIGGNALGTAVTGY